jgi:hypothetical protein
MDWLNEYAFKAEEMLDSDATLARRVYTRLASRLIECGTGSVLLFGTIKEDTKYALQPHAKYNHDKPTIPRLQSDSCGSHAIFRNQGFCR